MGLEENSFNCTFNPVYLFRFLTEVCLYWGHDLQVHIRQTQAFDDEIINIK